MGAISMPARSRQAAANNVGMALFLASWAMVFVTMLFAYAVLRTRQAVWPPLDAPPLPTGLAWLNTGVLLASSVTLQAGQQLLRQDNRAAFARLFLVTLGLGGLFLGLQARLWQEVHAAGLFASSNLYGSVVYCFTAFHAAHIVCALGLLLALLPKTLTHRYGPDEMTPVQMSTMFWHFLDVAWMAIFFAVFLV